MTIIDGIVQKFPRTSREEQREHDEKERRKLERVRKLQLEALRNISGERGTVSKAGRPVRFVKSG